MTNNDKKYKILIFSWNTESLNLCETLSQEEAMKNRTGISSVPLIGNMLTSWQYNCEIPDFFPNLKNLIIDNSPDIVVIGFQEDRYPGSYFHSHFLPTEMPQFGYGLVKRTKLMGLGITSYKGLLKGDPFERGIRVSIYAKDELVSIIAEEETEMRAILTNDGQDEYVCSSMFTRGKGATVSYLMLPGFGRLAFICCHLPFNSQSIINERTYHNKMLRQNELNRSNICFNSIIENLVIFKNPKPTHVIYFGDFNYRIAEPGSAIKMANDFINNANNPEFISNIYYQYDELLDQMRKENIYHFHEGVDNQGPTFIPTCKMEKYRINDMWKTGILDQRIPSWCDRILHQQFNNDGHQLKCIYYDRFDIGNVMSKSDHAAVVALYELY